MKVHTCDARIDLSDVRDVVRAYRLLMVCDRSHRVYNVGSGKAVRSRDVFDHLVRLTGQQRDVVQRSPGNRQQPIADISRLVRDTRWPPRLPLEQTIAYTLADFQTRARRRAD